MAIRCAPGVNVSRKVQSAAAAVLLTVLPCQAANGETVDQQLKSKVYRVNVAIRVTVGKGQYAQLADLSASKHYPVFATITEDKGLRVVGYGSCFPIRTTRDGGTYFLTNDHVVAFGEGMIEECQRFFAAMRLYAENTAGLQTPEQRYQALLHTVNLALKPNLDAGQRAAYEATVDAIWKSYDDNLSILADPKRKRFRFYLSQSQCKGNTGFFIHEMGASSKTPLVGSLYKRSAGKPDLAVLYTRGQHLQGLQVADVVPIPGQVVQAIGYPAIKQIGVLVPATYEPTITPGTVKRVTGDAVEFEAPVSRGDSGGPLLNGNGRVIGVVARRALLMRGLAGAPNEDRYASAISAAAIKRFVPELF